MSCKPALNASQAQSSCDLKIYYNTTKVPGLSRPVGVPSAEFPPPPSFPINPLKASTEVALNRTEPQFKAALFPMLYFHGGAGCSLMFRSPTVKGVRLDVETEPSFTAVSNQVQIQEEKPVT